MLMAAIVGRGTAHSQNLNQSPDFQTLRDSVTILFQSGKSAFDPDFEGNGEAIQTFIRKVRSLNRFEDVNITVEDVYIHSGSSPEGKIELNTQLARERQEAIISYLQPRMNIRDNHITRSDNVIDWNFLRSSVEQDQAMPRAWKKDFTNALDAGITNSWLIRKKVGEDAWNYLLKNHFPAMRKTTVVFTWILTPQEEEPEPEPEPEPLPQIPEPEPEPEPEPQIQPQTEPAPPTLSNNQPQPYSFTTRDMVVKVNYLTLPLLVINAGVELQVLPHFSVNVPIFYTGLDWFSETIKFRVLAVQPEIRYWLRRDMKGLFFGPHLNFGWYNIAVNGQYRYQDHAQQTPAFGGGLTVGYKIILGTRENSPWGLEFGLGAGYLPLHYDMYYNVKNGRYVGEDFYNYWGPDQAFLSITYRFGQLLVKKKK